MNAISIPLDPARIKPAEANFTSIKRPRIESVDLLRGLIMIIMALDHTRDFFTNAAFLPNDLSQTTPAYFFTRWITHFCAPVFFLLTGTGAYLSLRRKSKRELARFLWTRGLWLIFLDAVVLRCLGMQFNFDFHVTFLIVLWALGWAMIALSALLFLPDWLIAAISIVMIATHNLFDGISPAAFGRLAPLWTVLHVPFFLSDNPNHIVFVSYPLIPWVGVTAVGYVLGRVFNWPPDRRKTFLLRLGLALTAAFIILRAVNIYGDPAPWAPQKSAFFTVLSFLNTTKYPPSLLFLLMTLGPALLFLRAVDRHTPQFLRPALVYGKVPLFFYVLHFPLIHLIAVIICYARYGHIFWMFQSPALDQYPFTRPPGWGFGLPGVYLIWACVVIALYPICRRYAALKQRSSSPWLSYL
jgi:uncharacterized membrane protein